MCFNEHLHPDIKNTEEAPTGLENYHNYLTRKIPLRHEKHFIIIVSQTNL